MAVQIGDDIQQLTNELVGVLPILEIVWITGEPLRERLTVDVFHQYAIVRKRYIADEVGMFQPIARLKLLAEGLLVADIVGKLWLQPFQEMQLALEFDTVGVAGGSLRIYKFQGVKMLLTICKLR